MNLDKNEILARLDDMQQFEEIEILEVTSKYVKAYDKVDENEFYSRFPEEIDEAEMERLFDFGSVSMDEKAFYSAMNKSLDKNMLINVEKIYFLGDKEDYEKILLKYPDSEFFFEDHYGQREALKKGTIIFVNVNTIAKYVHNEAHLKGYTEDEALNFLVLESLVHELRHAITNNVLIQEEELPLSEGEEEAVIEYARKFVKEKFSETAISIV